MLSQSRLLKPNSSLAQFSQNTDFNNTGLGGMQSQSTVGLKARLGRPQVPGLNLDILSSQNLHDDSLFATGDQLNGGDSMFTTGGDQMKDSLFITDANNT